MSLYPSFLTPEIAYLPSIHLNSPPQTIFLNSTAVIAGRRRSTCRNPAAASRASYHRCRRPYTRPWISPWTEQSQAATRFRTPLQTPPPTSAAASAGKSAVPKLLLSLSLQVKRASIRSSRQQSAYPTSADRKYSIFTVDIATSPAINEVILGSISDKRTKWFLTANRKISLLRFPSPGHAATVCPNNEKVSFRIF
jgi:hypothetical protein